MIDISKYKCERASISRSQFDTEYITCYRASEVHKIVYDANTEIAKLNGIIEGMKTMAELAGKQITKEKKK